MAPWWAPTRAPRRAQNGPRNGPKIGRFWGPLGTPKNGPNRPPRAPARARGGPGNFSGKFPPRRERKSARFGPDLGPVLGLFWGPILGPPAINCTRKGLLGAPLGPPRKGCLGAPPGPPTPPGGAGFGTFVGYLITLPVGTDGAPREAQVAPRQGAPGTPPGGAHMARLGGPSLGCSIWSPMGGQWPSLCGPPGPVTGGVITGVVILGKRMRSCRVDSLARWRLHAAARGQAIA